jgi:hypothetical protein
MLRFSHGWTRITDKKLKAEILKTEIEKVVSGQGAAKSKS